MELTSKDIHLSMNVGSSYYITFCGGIKAIDEKSRSSIRKVVGNVQTEVYVERVEYNRKSAKLKCPCCGSGRAKYLRQVKERWVWYADINDIAVMVGFRAGRWKCSRCGRTYNDYPLGIMSYSRHSMIMMISVLKSLKKESIESVCRKYHIDHKTINRFLLDKIEITPDWDKLSQQKEVRLEVDEHSFGGRDMVITIVEAISHQVLAILKNATMKALKDYLKTIPKKVKKKVSVASTDLNASYWRVLEEWKKDIKLCADPFHVVGLANRLVNEERRFLQSQDKKRKLPAGPLRCGGERLRAEARRKRNIMLKRYPTLMISYQLKEELRAMYLTKDATEARLLFEDILSTIDKALSQRELLGIRQELATFGQTLHRWRERILNFFEYGLSTAMVEGFHTHIKLIKRISFGFKNKDIYRTKILLGLDHKNQKILKIAA